MVGVFLTLQEDGRDGCEELDKICRKLSEIKFKDTKTLIGEDFNPERFLPADRSYFSYLPDPPATAGVTWIISRQPMKVTEEQVDSTIKNLTDSNSPSYSAAADGESQCGPK